MGKFIKLLIIALVLICAGLYVSDPHFWQRYVSATKAKITKEPRGQWYSPLGDVDSAKGAELIRLSADSLDSRKAFKAALEETTAFVENRRSSSYLVWHNGSVATEKYFGETDKDTLIVSKSMAKPLAAMIVARAIHQGHIESLDQLAADFITEWQGTEKEAITVRHLLNMSSGLERFYRVTNNPFSSFHQAFLSGKHDDIIVNDIPLVEPPGSYYDYSQIASDLIAVLIERSTGKKYQQYVGDDLLSPIGAAGGTIWLNREEGVAHSGCCIMLPADTWLRLGVLLVQGGTWNDETILPAWWNEELLKGSPTNPNYGLYFWLGSPHAPRRHFLDPNHLPNPGILQSEPYAADDLFMFDGNGSQVIYIVPSQQLVVVRTGGWPGTDEQGNEWDNTYLPNTLLRALVSDQTATAPTFDTALERYQGLKEIAGNEKPLSAFESPQDTPRAPADSDAFLSAIQYADEMDSYALLVWQRGRLLLERYFDDHDADLRPEPASMHKSVLALLFMAALDDGFINSLNEPVGNYVAQWKGRPEGEIPIAALMTMSSGLKPFSREGGADSEVARFYNDGASVRKMLLAMRAEIPPNSRFRYANINSQILCLVLEAATGQPYDRYLETRLWQPIGAQHAFVWNYESDGFPRTYAHLLARPRDWLRIGLLMKNQGMAYGEQVVSKDGIQKMITPSDTNTNYGLQVWLGTEYEATRYYNDENTGPGFASKEPFAVDDMVYFDGIGGQRVYVSRKEDLVVVRMGDSRFDWDDTYLPNLIINELRQN